VHQKPILICVQDNALDEVLEEEGFIESLVGNLKETDQDHSIRLQAALKLNSSSGFDIVKSHSTKLADTSIEDLADLFLSAVRFDQTQVMEALIRDRRLDISCKYGNTDMMTFLHNAAQRKSIGALRLLLSLGADVNAVDEDDWTPLHFAVDGNANERHEQCISLLLDHGANVNAITHSGRTVWHAAAESTDNTAMRLLLERRGDDAQGLCLTDKSDLTPLFVAARKCDAQMCELLLSHDSYTPQICPQGLSLVHYAVKMSSIKILQILQEKHFELAEKARDGRTGLHFISSETTLDIVHLLMESGVDASSPALSGETPLHILACMWPMPRAKIFDALFDLLATKQSINHPTTRGFTPLHYALDPPPHLTRNFDEYSVTKHAESLLAKGADIHLRLADGISCLANLIKKYNTFDTEKVRALEVSQKDVSSRGYRNTNQTQIVLQAGRSRMQAFSKLVLTATTDLEMLTELIDGYGGRLSIRPLNWFIKFGDATLIDIFLEKGIDVDLHNTSPLCFEGSWAALGTACWFPCSLEVFQKLLKRSTHIQEFDSQGANLAHLTCMAGSNASPSILEELCKAGFDPNLPMASSNAFTPLMLAAKSGKQDHIQVLLDHGANIRLTDFRGTEAAHWAASAGKTAIIERFLEFGIDWNRCVYSPGYNILHLASLNGHFELVKFILDKSLIEDLDCVVEQGSALCHAVGRGYPEITEILLRAGANVDSVGIHGTRPIHVAARSGNISIIRILLNHGCSLVADNSKMTPQLTALKYRHQKAYDVLKEYESQKGALQHSCSVQMNLANFVSSKKDQCPQSIRIPQVLKFEI